MAIRRVAVILAFTLVAGWAGYTAYWFHAEGRVRKGLDVWAEQRRAEGWTIGWSEVSTGGYPTRLRLSLQEPEVVTPSGLAWRAEHLIGEGEPFDWTRFRFQAAGQHRLSWNGEEVAVSASAASADVNIDRTGGLEDVTVLLAGVTTDSLGATTLPPLSVDGLAFTWDPLPVTGSVDHSVATVRFSATAHGIHLPALSNLPLDRDIAMAEITGRVLGRIPDVPPVRALALWSADGGTVEIEHVSLDWTPMGLEGSGTLALDPQGQPLAAMSSRIHGFGPLMDRLVQAGDVDAGAGQAAKLVLAMMAKPDSKGRPAVQAPVTIQGGVLSLGPAQVAHVPWIEWPHGD